MQEIAYAVSQRKKEGKEGIEIVAFLLWPGPLLRGDH